MPCQTYGYIRVSTIEQNTDRQYAALEPFGIAAQNLYVDMQSGKDFERPAYKKLMKKLCYGDLLLVKSIDRLGRSYSEVIEEWRILTRNKGVDIKVLDMPLLDTTYHKDLIGTFVADLVLQVMCFTAQIERDMMLQRQAEGIAAAKLRGVRFGVKPLPMPNNFEELHQQWSAGELTINEFAAHCRFSRRTLYSRLKERRKRAESMDKIADQVRNDKAADDQPTEPPRET